MKNVLIPTDFSENAWNALEFALGYYANQPCNFHLLNTYTPAIVHSRYMAEIVGDNGVSGDEHIHSEVALKEWEEKIRNIHKDSNHIFIRHSSFNVLSEEISELTSQVTIDMVIGGATGASDKKDHFLGRSMVQIINAVEACPVMIVPKKSKYQKPKNILLVTDLSQGIQQETLEDLIKLAENNNSTLHVLGFTNSQRLNRNERVHKELLLENLMGLSAHWYQEPLQAKRLETIARLAKETQADLLVCPKHRKGFMEELIKEPTLKHSEYDLWQPLLVLPE